MGALSRMQASTLPLHRFPISRITAGKALHISPYHVTQNPVQGTGFDVPRASIPGRSWINLVGWQDMFWSDIWDNVHDKHGTRQDLVSSAFSSLGRGGGGGRSCTSWFHGHYFDLSASLLWFTKVMEHWFWVVPESNHDMTMTITAGSPQEIFTTDSVCKHIILLWTITEGHHADEMWLFLWYYDNSILQ